MGKPEEEEIDDFTLFLTEEGYKIYIQNQVLEERVKEQQLLFIIEGYGRHRLQFIESDCQ